MHVPVVDETTTFLHLGISFPFSKKETLPGVVTVAVIVFEILYLGEVLLREMVGVEE